MLVTIENEWTIYNTIDFVKTFQQEKEFRFLTGYKGKLDEYDYMDDDDQTIIETLLEPLPKHYLVTYDNHTTYFTIMQITTKEDE